MSLRQRNTKLDDLLTYDGPLADSEQEEFVALMECEAVSSQIRIPLLGCAVSARLGASSLFRPAASNKGAPHMQGSRALRSPGLHAGDPLPTMADSNGGPVFHSGHPHDCCWRQAASAPLGPQAPCVLQRCAISPPAMMHPLFTPKPSKPSTHVKATVRDTSVHPQEPSTPCKRLTGPTSQGQGRSAVELLTKVCCLQVP